MMLTLNPVPSDILFRGRPGDPRLGEWVRCVSAASLSVDKKRASVVVLGNPDDLGVVRNRGRQGAALGPDSIRRHLYKMTPPADFAWEDRLQLFDLGNVAVTSELAVTHSRTEAAARAVGESGAVLASLGGGNDFTAPGFAGFVAGARARGTKGAFGIVNIDPHLDVRPLENDEPHSGTPYRQLIENGVVAGKHVVQFGSRANRNARDHWRYCEERGVKIVSFENLRAGKATPAERLRATLAQLGQKCAGLGVSIDVDCCADGEGTSAAPVLGFSAWELCALAAVAGAHPKVAYFELVEVAPSLDPTERTSRIAAEALYAFLRSLAEHRKAKHARARR